MKKLILGLFLGLVGFGYTEQFQKVITNNFQILPMRDNPNPSVWVNASNYVNGTIVSANGDIWMCLFPGISSTNGTGPLSTNEYDFLVTESNTTWMLVSRARERQGFDISNTSSTGGVLTIGSSTLTNNVGTALPIGQTYSKNYYDNGVWVNAASSTPISVTTWFNPGL